MIVDLLIIKKQYDLALIDFNKAIEINPYNGILYFIRGRIYIRQEHFDLAIKDFTQTIELDPQDPNVYMGRGISYNRNYS